MNGHETLEDLGAELSLLAQMGHEIKNPLNAVLGFAQLMVVDEQDPVDDWHRAQLHAIAEISRHMLGIVNDMIATARAERASHTATDASVDASPLASVPMRRGLKPPGRPRPRPSPLLQAAEGTEDRY
jgi:signal transduction histidine kinase